MIASELEYSLGEALVAAKHGDRAAFGRFVGLTQGMLTGLALSITADPALSEDIAQETYLETWKRLATLRTDASALPWLREIVRNKSIDVLRRRKRVGPAPSDAQQAQVECPQTQPQDALQAEQQLSTVLRALAKLSEPAREVVLLFYREGERTQRVATLLGVSDAVVRKRLQRARDRLRFEVQAQIKTVAIATAPGAGLAATVIASLSPIGTASAVGASVGKSTLQSWTAAAWSGLGAAVAAVGVVVGAVLIDTRIALARTRDPLKRRRLVMHGMVYAAVLGGYIVVLDRAADSGWSLAWIAGLAVSAIFGLTYWRMRILR